MRLFSAFIFITLSSLVSRAQINGQLVEQSLDIKIPFTITRRVMPTFTAILSTTISILV